MKSSNPTAQAQRRYLIACTLATIAYVIVLVTTLSVVGRFEPQGLLRYAIILAPLVPVAFLTVSLLRYFRDTDEFERRVMTESLAIAAGITAMLAVTYGFLESTGLPHLSAWYTWTAVMGSWFVARFFVARRYE